MSTLTLSPPAVRLPVPVLDALVAIAVAAALVAYHAATGFPTLVDSAGDNDSVMRLVRVRDLLAGQGWFDPMQYRMGIDGGLALHWSRLVDLPIAVLIMLFGESAALVIWPSILFAGALFFLLRAARNIGERNVGLPAAVIGGAVLYFLNIFTPGALDHHNVQLVLALATLVMLLRHGAPLACGAAAGGLSALMLAVGMEAVPIVATACASVALAFLWDGRESRSRAAGFGTAFAGTAVLCFLLTVPPGQWLAQQCDAFSLPQAALSALGGLGLAAASLKPLTTRTTRAGMLAALTLLCGGVLLLAFPGCLSDPYANLDPRLLRYWLNAVVEAQSVTSILRTYPAMFAAYYATPMLALAAMPFLWRRGEGREMATMAAVLAAAFALSLWQVRGSVFSLPLAAIPLAAFVAKARTRVDGSPSARAQLVMVAAWLMSINIVWQSAVGLVASEPSRAQTAEAAADRASTGACTAEADHVELAALDPGTVLAVSNLGAPILAYTSHKVLAGPYHRNVAGNLAALDMLMGLPREAEVVARRLGVDYIALCPGNSETRALAKWAPEGLAAVLASGETPSWLAPVSADRPLKLFLLRPR